jgi:hypothetical protein
MSSHLTKNSKRSKEIDLGVGNISSYFIGFFLTLEPIPIGKKHPKDSGKVFSM